MLSAGQARPPGRPVTMSEQLVIPTLSGTFDALAAGPEDGRPVLLLGSGSINSRRWAPPGFAAAPSISAAIHPASPRRRLTRTTCKSFHQIFFSGRRISGPDVRALTRSASRDVIFPPAGSRRRIRDDQRPIAPDGHAGRDRPRLARARVKRISLTEREIFTVRIKVRRRRSPR
jgi:hypothetical protein